MAIRKIHPPGSPTQPGRTRAAIYARVSTSNNGQDPTMQTRELEEYCQRRGWELAGRYVDNGVSGSKESRPELDRLMTGAHRRRFHAVAVWKFDRFARSVSHLLRALETFKALFRTLEPWSRGLTAEGAPIPGSIHRQPINRLLFDAASRT
jgi:predicted site-specific integrase-resolvase